ncbi:MAG TPA: hypothetical protein EYP10_06640 [Armatimonadetes bacterium]|nr:hypothetical protein [Armatimonadota bacterium]
MSTWFATAQQYGKQDDGWGQIFGKSRDSPIAEKVAILNGSTAELTGSKPMEMGVMVEWF